MQKIIKGLALALAVAFAGQNVVEAGLSPKAKKVLTYVAIGTGVVGASVAGYLGYKALTKPSFKKLGQLDAVAKFDKEDALLQVDSILVTAFNDAETALATFADTKKLSTSKEDTIKANKTSRELEIAFGNAKLALVRALGKNAFVLDDARKAGTKFEIAKEAKAKAKEAEAKAKDPKAEAETEKPKV